MSIILNVTGYTYKNNVLTCNLEEIKKFLAKQEQTIDDTNHI